MFFRRWQRGGTGVCGDGGNVSARCDGPAESQWRCDGALTAEPGQLARQTRAALAEPGRIERQTTAAVWCAGPAEAPQIEEFYGEAVDGDFS